MNSKKIKDIITPDEYADIKPIDDKDFNANMKTLVDEPLFEHAVKYVLPDIDMAQFKAELLSITNKDDFHRKIMAPFLLMLEQKTTKGITSSGTEYLDASKSYTFISNHRDIVLDASFLNLSLLKNGLFTTEVAIGSNLLIHSWIETLVKLNKSFIVKRNVGFREALEAAIQLSGYIHFTIKEKHESIWIAQREGRAKDSNDLTQESLIKMLSLAGEGDVLAHLTEINLCPVSLSYEYDPNDYLKAKEYLLKQKDPQYRKSERDDLFSMETGILHNKGRVHIAIAKPLNETLLNADIDRTNKVDVLNCVRQAIDRSIHLNYKFYPCNYIAYDMLHSSNKFADTYTDEEYKEFETYLCNQLKKVDLENISAEDNAYMHKMILLMYSNPLHNYLDALSKE